MSPLPGRLVLLGHPVAHSLSPRMHDAALRAAGLALEYEAWDVTPARVPDALATLKHLAGAGNVTVPHKATVHALCDRLTASAEHVGAVNTFRHEDGALVGENTDVAGFQALAELVLGSEPRGHRIALLGAGGAAAAVCTAVSDWQGSRIVVHSRTPDRPGSLRARFAGLVSVAASVDEAVRDADVVVNATPVGLHGDDQPVPVRALRRDAVVMDLAYRVGETPWVRAAREAGHVAVDGLEMLIAQGARAFEWWFGITPDVDRMRDAVRG